MAIDLSDEQRHALECGRAVPVQDGARTYYVITDDQFQRMKLLFEVEEVDRSLYEAGDVDLYETR